MQHFKNPSFCKFLLHLLHVRIDFHISPFSDLRPWHPPSLFNKPRPTPNASLTPFRPTLTFSNWPNPPRSNHVWTHNRGPERQSPWKRGTAPKISAMKSSYKRAAKFQGRNGGFCTNQPSATKRLMKGHVPLWHQPSSHHFKPSFKATDVFEMRAELQNLFVEPTIPMASYSSPSQTGGSCSSAGGALVLKVENQIFNKEKCPWARSRNVCEASGFFDVVPNTVMPEGGAHSIDKIPIFRLGGKKKPTKNNPIKISSCLQLLCTRHSSF